MSSNPKRGRAVVVRPPVEYRARKSYTWEDVVALGKQVKDGTVTMSQIRNEKDADKYKVPYGSMLKWDRDDHEEMKKSQGKRGVRGEKHWFVELHTRGRTTLTAPGGTKGGGTILGAGERVIMIKAAEAALEGHAWTKHELKDCVLNTLEDLGIKNAATGRVYDATSDLRTLVSKVVARAEAKGIYFMEKPGRSIGKARLQALRPEVLVRHRGAAVVGPARARAPRLPLLRRGVRVSLARRLGAPG